MADILPNNCKSAFLCARTDLVYNTDVVAQPVFAFQGRVSASEGRCRLIRCTCRSLVNHFCFVPALPAFGLNERQCVATEGRCCFVLRASWLRAHLFPRICLPICALKGRAQTRESVWGGGAGALAYVPRCKCLFVRAVSSLLRYLRFEFARYIQGW